MERIRRMLRRKAGQVAPEPAVNISEPSQEESGPSVPAGGEEACGQGKERSCVACWRRRKTPAPLADPEAPSGPKWKWPRVQLWRREPGEGRSRGRQLWGFLRRKPRSQELCPRAQQELSTTMATEEPCASPTLAPDEPPASTTLATKKPPASPTLAPEEPPASPTLATAEPPASPTLAIEEPPASPEQELSDCATNTSSSAYSCGASSSSVGSGNPEFKGSLFGGQGRPRGKGGGLGRWGTGNTLCPSARQGVRTDPCEPPKTSGGGTATPHGRGCWAESGSSSLP
ncbi:proline-rich receptor-like protein kinase PERK12 [Mauremys reevesii]|uniref:proline-rich receptor-like protein kinase PERK12 n=1 Tax=Mauremys reevesii TaxID=260615 RepID=UPI00193ED229|nr:proline-rich receptor-like protein kinase PERK12 [Mauremys reevesii]XP_039374545.1 proline-rich receptor-like protein kinase PERK12 [Mauremys reevesii]